MIKFISQVLHGRWNSYKYRFVPWMAVNLGKNERTLRQVKARSQDKVVPDSKVFESLLSLFKALFASDLERQRQVLHLLPFSLQTSYQALGRSAQVLQNCHPEKHDPVKVMLDTLGFSVKRRPSSVPSAGIGVFVAMGTVSKGAVVAMYPGTVYEMYEPIFLQSLCNPFVFRCIDGILIDGKDKGISKIVYRSCSSRDRLGAFTFSDTTWLTAKPDNPLAVDKAANVCYQEFDISTEFPLELCQYLPNVNYRNDTKRPLRCVVLVALRDIRSGEELFSNYYTNWVTAPKKQKISTQRTQIQVYRRRQMKPFNI
ncbi:SET domain-containing protein 9 isoform X2 [Scleropages formosus]|uniref:SET domain-containing protein 9 isoform X2 n=1 Tax=Scleropages formosus TaxID=113540 RepID=UPI000878E579|nr:SET domain-containing protein 9 isoform X2 [Scleropages formosus]